MAQTRRIARENDLLLLDPACGLSWREPCLPAVYSLKLSGDVSPRCTSNAVGALQSMAGGQVAGRAVPQVVTVHVEQPEVRVRSFFFEGAGGDPSETASEQSGSGNAVSPRSAASRPAGGDGGAAWARPVLSDDGAVDRARCLRPPGFSASRGRLNGPRDAATRIRPPKDVIKLSDRLFLLLQPPVEWLVEELLLPAKPFAFQFEGVGFLYSRHAAVLADEMGLGKTMQAVTAIRLLRREGRVRHVLLVCPKSLVRNWQREFRFWAPELSVVPVEGNPAERRAKWQAENVVVKIANYEVLVRDRSVFAPPQPDGRPVCFDLVVLDEAQRIKNASSLTHEAACSLSRRRSWALTGTPVENSTDDLVGIFGFVAPGLISAGMKPRAMAEAAGEWILRRTKERVLAELPPMWFRDAEILLSPEQQQTYEAAEEEGVLRLGRMGQTATIGHVFELLIRLKQICNFDPVTGASAKLERLEADLEEVAASGRKAVVFSQWVETLEELSVRLARFHPVQYHGRVRPTHRGSVIDRFRNDPQCRVLLISYGAGGVGLNLQFAGYVFLFDRWWNPAVEDQAINRLHRIGLQAPITVTRFLTLGTIEERISQILEEKRQLFHQVLSEASGSCRLGLSHEELFGLFGLPLPGRGQAA